MINNDDKILGDTPASLIENIMIKYFIKDYENHDLSEQDSQTLYDQIKFYIGEKYNQIVSLSDFKKICSVVELSLLNRAQIIGYNADIIKPYLTNFCNKIIRECFYSKHP